MTTPAPITVSVVVPGPPEVAWRAFTEPSAITEWNFASPDWHCPAARSDLRPGGSFSYRMEARDGSMGFDYEGTFRAIDPVRELRIALGPDRDVVALFEPADGGTRVSQTFTPETEFPLEQQRAGWQAILDNFKAYVARAG
jgi:uncharacterized protein YndB with AHSA1/START domain